jgi:prepilin-type N-terminal cleavage/methylation domain-containing protein
MYLNNRGFSLVEALVTSVILGVISLTMASVISNMNRETSMLRGKAGALELAREIRPLLAINTPTKRQCKDTFAGIKLSSALLSNPAKTEVLPELKIDHLPLLTPNKPLDNYNIRLISMFFTNATVSASAPKLLLDVMLDAASIESFGKATNSSPIRMFKPLRVATLDVQTDASGTITDCLVFEAPGAGGGGNCYPPVDPSRPITKRTIVCSAGSDFQVVPLDVVWIKAGIIRYMETGRSSNPTILEYNPDTGAFLGSSGYLGGQIRPECKQNLSKVLLTPLNACN